MLSVLSTKQQQQQKPKFESAEYLDVGGLGQTYLIPFPNKPCFYVSVGVQVFCKDYGKKEKLLVTGNFSFSHSVFYLFE